MDEDDEELNRAIALSLQSHEEETGSRPFGNNEIIDLTSSDEEGPKQPRKAKGAGSSPSQALTIDSDDESGGKVARTPPQREGNDDNHESQEPFKSSVLGLDRKAMEQERLARKRKAQGEISPPSTSRDSKVNKSSGSARSAAKSKPPAKGTDTKLQFPHGAVKRTSCHGLPRTDEDISIDEVIQRPTLQLAVLSSFQWDTEWLLSKVDYQRTRMIFVAQAKDEDTKRENIRNSMGIPTIKFCFPSMDGVIGCMHSKLMLLSYGHFLRVVVPSANLMPHDWGETGVMENIVFLIDLPRREAQTSNVENHFYRSLVYFCKAIGLDESIVSSLKKFDFSAASKYGFVHSIGGQHSHLNADRESGEDNEPRWHLTGFPSLGRAVRRLGLSTKEIGVDYVASSIGALNLDFLSSLYTAARGSDALAVLKWRSSGSSGRGKAQSGSLQQTDSREEVHGAVQQNLRVYFPSSRTVRDSRGGTRSAGTICFSRQWYEAEKFPREVMRDCISTRLGLLMHSKILYVRALQGSTLNALAPTGQNCDGGGDGFGLTDGQSDAISEAHGATKQTCGGEGDYEFDSEATTASGGSPARGTSEAVVGSTPPNTAWAYIGSANCSVSAWGKLVLDRQTKQPRLECRNWECGVVVPASALDSASKVPICDGGRLEGSLKIPSDRQGGEISGEREIAGRGPKAAGGKLDGGGLEVFAGVVPVVMQVPGGLMGRGDAGPWFNNEG